MSRVLSRTGAVVVVVLLATWAAPARAATDAERPWAKDIPPEKQEQALRLFNDGNKLFEDSQHTAALAKYREAIALWDHPAIRYNAAVALIHLDQPLAAHESLERALRYGDAPLGAETYQQALTYRKLLVGQLAELKVTCAEQDADVTLDGMPLFLAPGEVSRWLLPGTHQLVARKPGFLPETRALSLLPGRPAVETLTLQEIRSIPPQTRRRWTAWKPWAVLGGGAALALIGLPLMLDARSNIDAYDAEVRDCAKQAGGLMGCPLDMISPTALNARDRGRTESIVAVSLFTVGGVVAAAGAALVILNQPRVVPAETQVSLTPLLGPGQVGLSFAFQR